MVVKSGRGGVCSRAREYKGELRARQKDRDVLRDREISLSINKYWPNSNEKVTFVFIEI